MLFLARINLTTPLNWILNAFFLFYSFFFYFNYRHTEDNIPAKDRTVVWSVNITLPIGRITTST